MSPWEKMFATAEKVFARSAILTVTMTTRTAHPTDEALAAYIQGRLSLHDSAALDRHIETCNTCSQKLAQVGSDTFCELLRQPTQVIASSPELKLPQELQGHPRYEIQKILGHGGMGIVYLARHRIMNRLVALKLIRRELLASPEAVDRFRREVRAAAQLAHPNIVTAYDAEEIGGVHFLAMEYVNGKTLDAIIRKRGPLPIPVACHLARQVALGLEHAHSRGMIHRDIKPQNLILADKSTVKILDFGLARWHADEPIPDSATREGIVLGTLAYAAPEQHHSAADVDARVDVYSLGATLGYLLTGEVPGTLSDWPDAIPDQLRIVLNRMLAALPDERFSSAKELIEALTPWCGRRSPQLEPSSTSTRRKWLEIMGSTAVIGVTGGVWFATRPPNEVPTIVSALKPASESHAPKSAQKPLTQSEPEWRSLLGFDPARYAVAGCWERIGDELRVNAELRARIAIPFPVPVEYDLRCDFTRITGANSVGMIVVQNGRQVVFDLDAWLQHLGGFQNIAGQTLIQNPTRRENVHLVNNHRYTMLVEVRRDSIRGFLNGELIATHRTDGRDLSVTPEWGQAYREGLGLVAWNSATIFHQLEIAAR